MQQAPAITSAVGRTIAAAPNAAPAATTWTSAWRSDESASSAATSKQSSRPSDRMAVSMRDSGPIQRVRSDPRITQSSRRRGDVGKRLQLIVAVAAPTSACTAIANFTAATEQQQRRQKQRITRTVLRHDRPRPVAGGKALRPRQVFSRIEFGGANEREIPEAGGDGQSNRRQRQRRRRELSCFATFANFSASHGGDRVTGSTRSNSTFSALLLRCSVLNPFLHYSPLRLKEESARPSGRSGEFSGSRAPGCTSSRARCTACRARWLC